MKMNRKSKEITKSVETKVSLFLGIPLYTLDMSQYIGVWVWAKPNLMQVLGEGGVGASVSVGVSSSGHKVTQELPYGYLTRGAGNNPHAGFHVWKSLVMREWASHIWYRAPFQSEQPYSLHGPNSGCCKHAANMPNFQMKPTIVAVSAFTWVPTQVHMTL